MILAGIILAEAAAIYDGKNAVQTQRLWAGSARRRSPRPRSSSAEDEIDYPKVIGADVLVAMSQEACDKYASSLKKSGMLIVDEEKVGRVPTTRAVKVPITRLAVEATGKVITANVVALGVLVGLTRRRLARGDRKSRHGPRAQGTEEMNRAALGGRVCRAQNAGSGDSRLNVADCDR